MSKKIAIIDYKLGNLFSVKHACDYVGLDSVITSDASFISDADALILPGVGAFGEGMIHLNELGLSSVIKEKVSEGIPLFGICLGLQMLFTESEEFGNSKGLDIIKGKIMKFPKNYKSNHLKVPQIGWNKIHMQNENLWNSSSLSGIKVDTFMYFIHSFYAKPDNDTEVLTNTNYCGFEYCSAVFNNRNVFATQFHPEKSGENGLKIYEQWGKNYNLFE